MSLAERELGQGLGTFLHSGSLEERISHSPEGSTVTSKPGAPGMQRRGRSRWEEGWGDRKQQRKKQPDAAGHGLRGGA